MIFQNPDNQIIATVVEDDVAWALTVRGISAVEIRKRVEEALERVAGAVSSNGATGEDQRGRTAESEVVAVDNVRSGSTRLIPRSAILYAQSHGDFVRIVTDDGRYLLRATLGDIETRWQPFGFVRVHRQYLANLARAVELRPQLGGSAELVFADGHTIPVARRQAAELGRRLRAV